MLEHLPAWLGHMLRDRRAGHEKLVAADAEIRLGADTIDFSSPATDTTLRDATAA